MRTVIQRVTSAAVRVADKTVGKIDHGALLLVGIDKGDSERDVTVTAQKIIALRFFPGETPMGKTLATVGGACLVVSQFTLSGSLRKGTRPSFNNAEDPGRAEQLYELLIRELRDAGLPCQTGEFGGDMAVELVNDGPITFVLEVRDGKVL